MKDSKISPKAKEESMMEENERQTNPGGRPANGEPEGAKGARLFWKGFSGFWKVLFLVLSSGLAIYLFQFFYQQIFGIDGYINNVYVDTGSRTLTIIPPEPPEENFPIENVKVYALLDPVSEDTEDTEEEPLVFSYNLPYDMLQQKKICIPFSAFSTETTDIPQISKELAQSARVMRLKWDRNLNVANIFGGSSLGSYSQRVESDLDQTRINGFFVEHPIHIVFAYNDKKPIPRFGISTVKIPVSNFDYQYFLSGEEEEKWLSREVTQIGTDSLLFKSNSIAVPVMGAILQKIKGKEVFAGFFQETPQIMGAHLVNQFSGGNSATKEFLANQCSSVLIKFAEKNPDLIAEGIKNGGLFGLDPASTPTLNPTNWQNILNWWY